jgi:hypothetical protein
MTAPLAAIPAPFLTLVMCEPNTEMHFVAVVPALARKKTPPREFVTH